MPTKDVYVLSKFETNNFILSEKYGLNYDTNLASNSLSIA